MYARASESVGHGALFCLNVIEIRQSLEIGAQMGAVERPLKALPAERLCPVFASQRLHHTSRHRRGLPEGILRSIGSPNARLLDEALGGIVDAAPRSGSVRMNIELGGFRYPSIRRRLGRQRQLVLPAELSHAAGNARRLVLSVSPPRLATAYRSRCRASDYESGGRRFESFRARQNIFQCQKLRQVQIHWLADECFA